MNPLKPRKLYLDTSVIGGYFDEEFKEATRRLWELAEAGEYQFVSSEVTKGEMVDAPEHVRVLFESTFADLLTITEDARTLALAYLEQEVVTEKYYEDALHVAVATVEGVNLLVSWNFKHLVNIHREEAFNAVNLINGYTQLRIVTPKELEL